MRHFRNWLSLAVLSIFTVGMLLAGCASQKAPQSSGPSSPASVQPENPVTEAPSPETEPTQIYLYIGTASGGFRTYPAEIEGEVTAESLIEEISRLTGWDLTLADQVTSGKGGMTVSFSPSCAIFTGPPEPQKDEFFVYDNVSLAQMILDTVQQTLQQNFVLEPGDPSSLDIWFSVEDQPIEIENLLVPMDKPWDNEFSMK